MNRILSFILILLLCLPVFELSAQSSNATLWGKVIDESGNPIELVNVSIRNFPIGTITNKKGEYLLRIPSGRDVSIDYSMIGYEMVEKLMQVSSESSIEMNITLKTSSKEINEIVVTDQRQTSGNIVKINPKSINGLPDVGMGSVEGIIKTLPGVSASNELSSQYSVRGGSFDENLVYVNDIEVYRPFLVRSGQQEGMSFVNSDMVSSIEFSSGGFDAKYGDKMSSVLDIKYNRPSEFSASVSASLMGVLAHVENSSRDKKFTYNMGIRYKSFKFLLGTLDNKGDYNPSFIDFQGYYTYQLSDKTELSFLGTASSNQYQFYPQSRESREGTATNQRILHVYYDGKEIDRYYSYTGALNLNYKPTNHASLNFTASAFQTFEQETYDIIGTYYFNEIGNPGTEQQNDSVLNLGRGLYHEHGRNYFDASVVSFEHRGKIKTKNNFFQWGLNFKEEMINDHSKEWEYHDSAGYSLPHSDKEINLFYLTNTDTALSTQRYTAFLQDSYSVPVGIGSLMFTGGLRAHFWTYTNKLSVSPRFSASLKTGTKNDIVARLSFGWYYQPPFYRELKDLSGHINPNIQTPRSIQAVAGVDFSFVGWDRPFKMTSEVYYKSLKDLIPYQYENVRIRYLSDQISNGYAYGLDLKVNGEFVSGTQSWVSASLMKTEEDIVGDINDKGKSVGYIPRPNDQRFKFSMFFQDYMPGLPAYQMHLTGHFITGVPFGLPHSPRWTQGDARIKAYKRVDIGFLRMLVSDGKNLSGWKFLDKFKECSVGIEIFNILDIPNISSYTFIADYENNYHSVQDRLTGRMLNLKISAGF
jgi:hypothetical protein